jgi:Sec-independent protein translocase protein TatA
LSLIIASAQADAVGWICLVIGILVLGAGVFTGLRTSLSEAPGKAKDKLDEASQKIAEAKEHIDRTTEAMEGGMAAAVSAEARSAGEAAGTSADAAKSAIEQVEGIVGALPENLRFAGVLVLVGTVLIGVATIQFGGTSLF